MRLAIHHQALLEMFGGKCDPLTTNAVLSSKVSITPEILANYQNHVAANTNYQAWFASSSAARRFCLNLPQHAPASVQSLDPSTDGYGTASYFGSSNLVANGTSLSGVALAALATIGVDMICPKSKLPNEVAGDNPFLTLALKADGGANFDVLDRFIAPEESIVIYDKYVNDISIDLLEHIVARMSGGSVLTIFHTFIPGRNLLDSATIEARLRAKNPAITIVSKIIDANFSKQAHDRYIFFGRRIQVVFSVGLDCFGAINAVTKQRKNRQSKISFYEVTDCDELHILASDGTSRTVKHYTNI